MFERGKCVAVQLVVGLDFTEIVNERCNLNADLGKRFTDDGRQWLRKTLTGERSDRTGETQTVLFKSIGEVRVCNDLANR